MTSRQRFEAELSKRKDFKPPSFRLTNDGGYYFDLVQIAWESWQAAERNMLERLHSLIRNSNSRAEAVAHIEELLK